MNQPLLFVTGNKKKYEEALHILDPIPLEQIALDLPEIQGNRFEVSEAKALEAFKRLQRPLVIDDVSICCPALKDLPGPYIKDFLKHLGEEGIYDLLSRYEDRTAFAICTLAYIEEGIQPVLVEGMIEGTIVAPKGIMRHGALSWNPIFQPKGMTRTMGEMTMEEHAKFSQRGIAFNHLKKYLEERSKA